MKDKKPYLLQAFYEWIVDSSCIPYILVAVDEKTIVPAAHIKNGKIVLNISPTACADLRITEEAVTFNARFSGRATPIYVPIKNIEAIYARENGEGMFFGDVIPTRLDADTSCLAPNEGKASEVKSSPVPSKPTLKVIK